MAGWEAMDQGARDPFFGANEPDLDAIDAEIERGEYDSDELALRRIRALVGRVRDLEVKYLRAVDRCIAAEADVALLLKKDEVSERSKRAADARVARLLALLADLGIEEVAV